MPVTLPAASPPGNILPRLIRKIDSLVAVVRSIGPSNGIDTRGRRLKPSRVLMTSRSSQSEGRAEQSGLGILTLSPVFWLGSTTVKTLLGKGPPPGVRKSKRAWTSAASADDAKKKTRLTAKSEVRRPHTTF